MNNGKMEQVGTPDDLMSKPTSSFGREVCGPKESHQLFL